MVSNDAASTAQDGHKWCVGASSARLDGGDGDDLIGFDRDDTIIRPGSDEVMRIENATGLNIGFQTDRYREEWSDGSIHEGEFSKGDGEVLNDRTIFTDLDGNEVDRSSLDVVINSYLTLDT